MSLVDYTALKTAISSDWLHRSDLTTAAGDFIALFESDFNAQMRCRQMEQQTAITSTAGYLIHPTSWLGWKEIRSTGSNPYDLEPASDEIALSSTSGESTPARKYKVFGTKTYLYPGVSGVSLTAKYWEGVALTSGTNWLLTAYPGAYLYGSLLQATAFIGDDARLGLWQAAYQGIMENIKKDSRMSSWSGQALSPKPDVRVV